jgi:hypothetical protein
MHHLRVMLSGFVLLLCAGPAQAEQSAVFLRPHFAADKELTLEIVNTSKLPATLRAATIELGDGAACTVKLPEPVVLGSAGSKKIVIAANEVVKACIKPPASPKDKPLSLRVMTEAEHTARPTLQVIRHAKLHYELQIGKHTASETTTWHFVKE